MPGSLIYLLGIATALGLAGSCLAWVGWSRRERRQQEAFDAALADLESQIEAERSVRAAVEERAAALWEVDSLQLARRYVDARQALDARLSGLQTELRQLARRRDELGRHLADLDGDDPSRDRHVESVRGEMERTHQEVMRLEQILGKLDEMGSIPAEDVRRALERRLGRKGALQGRLERLTADGPARQREVARLRRELDHVRFSEGDLEHEENAVRSAAALLDDLLDVGPETQERISALEDRVSSSVRLLASARGAEALRSVMRASRRRLPAPREPGREAGRSAEKISAPKHAASPARSVGPMRSARQAWRQAARDGWKGSQDGSEGGEPPAAEPAEDDPKEALDDSPQDERRDPAVARAGL